MNEGRGRRHARPRTGIACTWMRGGTSKGAFFLADDLPPDPAERDRLLLSLMGSPDPRQIDGIGGADPLTSKVAVIGPASRPDADIDYLFLQVFVDRPVVSAAQNCGNLLAGVGQFAVEKRLVAVRGPLPTLRVHMVNSGQIAHVRFPVEDGMPVYDGDARIDGVPRPGAPVLQNFPDAAGSTCGALLPTGRPVDEVAGIGCTLIDNGMPVVVMAAADLGIAGDETREELDADQPLKQRLEAIRIAAGPLMNLGDVGQASVPKMTLVSPPQRGGTIATRTFIPHRCHASIGVFGAVSVATACLLPAGPAAACARLPAGAVKNVSVEHPSGETRIVIETEAGRSGPVAIRRAEIVRTARKLFEGRVFPHF